MVRDFNLEIFRLNTVIKVYREYGLAVDGEIGFSIVGAPHLRLYLRCAATAACRCLPAIDWKHIDFGTPDEVLRRAIDTYFHPAGCDHLRPLLADPHPPQIANHIALELLAGPP